MAPMATIVRRKTDFVIAERNTAITQPWNKEPMAATGAYGYIIEALPRLPDSEKEEPYCKRSSGLQLKNRHAIGEDPHDKRQSHSS